MIADPRLRGEALATFYAAVAPRLWADLAESGALPPGTAETRERAVLEWECFALYACVRGLVAAGGFNQETAAAVNALHEAVLERWSLEAASADAFEARRARIAERYAEYGHIGQELEASGAHLVSQRLGEAAARHMTEPDEPPGALGALVGGLHEALAEGATEAVKRG